MVLPGAFGIPSRIANLAERESGRFPLHVTSRTSFPASVTVIFQPAFGTGFAEVRPAGIRIASERVGERSQPCSTVNATDSQIPLSTGVRVTKAATGVETADAVISISDTAHAARSARVVAKTSAAHATISSTGATTPWRPSSAARVAALAAGPPR